MEPILQERRKITAIDIVLILLVLAVIAIIAAAWLQPQQAGPATAPTTLAAHECPQPRCLDWIDGSCLGPGERYTERTCFGYDAQCGESVYYEKASRPDEAC